MVTRARFIEILREFLEKDRDRLEKKFEEGARLREREGWAWDVFVQSFATNGGVKRWDAFVAEGGAERVRWDALFADAPGDVAAAASRLQALSVTFLAPRWAARTGPALIAAFHRFHKEGGPDAVARTWMGHNETGAMLRWLKSFRMIGDKYARNMAMDVSHPLVLDHIALDHRIHALCDLVEGAPPRTPYRLREGWLREIAAELGINGWLLDRLLFSRYKEIRAAILKDRPGPS